MQNTPKAWGCGLSGEWGHFGRVIVSNKKSSPFGLLLRLSGKRDSSPRCAWAISRELYLHSLTPWQGATWGRFVANHVFRSKQSLPYQREVWRDCLYGRGLFRETHKKKDSFMLSFVRWAENETRTRSFKQLYFSVITIKSHDSSRKIRAIIPNIQKKTPKSS